VKIPNRLVLLVGVIVGLIASASPAGAQDSGDGFLFRPPSGSFSLRGGFAMPNAGSDIFSFTTSRLTVNRSDFDALDIGADLSFSLSPRLDLVLDVSHSEMNKGSEFRNFVDNNQQPIQQSTGFKRTPVTVNLRYYLAPRGTQVGRFAWVPSTVSPYVGAGAGFMYYEFTQSGDFIDDSTLAVFPDSFHSAGWAGMGQVLAGADWSLGSHWALRTEARYLFSNAPLSDDFSGFHRIDLSGVTTSVGFFVRF
jgi:outer membrane protein W